jgi:hypothetical protein
VESCARVEWHLRDANMGRTVTQCNAIRARVGVHSFSGRYGWAGRDQRIVVCFDLQSVGQQVFFLTSARSSALVGRQLGVGARVRGECGWCRERWTPRRDLMKPSRGLLKPARCAVALVQLAVPTGGLVQAIEAADIKRALHGARDGGRGRGGAA